MSQLCEHVAWPPVRSVKIPLVRCEDASGAAQTLALDAQGDTASMTSMRREKLSSSTLWVTSTVLDQRSEDVLP